MLNNVKQTEEGPESSTKESAIKQQYQQIISCVIWLHLCANLLPSLHSLHCKLPFLVVTFKVLLLQQMLSTCQSLCVCVWVCERAHAHQKRGKNGPEGVCLQLGSSCLQFQRHNNRRMHTNEPTKSTDRNSLLSVLIKTYPTSILVLSRKCFSLRGQPQENSREINVSSFVWFQKSLSRTRNKWESRR